MKANPWPWGLAASFLILASLQVALMVKASRGFEGPDDQRYYRHGLEYGEELKRQRRQQELGWSIQTGLPEILPADSSWRLQPRLLDSRGRPLEGARIEIQVGRPATRTQDRKYRLDMAEPALDLRLERGIWELVFTATLEQEIIRDRRRVRVR